VEIRDGAVITSSSKWCKQVVNKSNSPIQTPSIVTQINRDILVSEVVGLETACLLAKIRTNREEMRADQKILKEETLNKIDANVKEI
jgi:hypothetical protein